MNLAWTLGVDRFGGTDMSERLTTIFVCFVMLIAASVGPADAFFGKKSEINTTWGGVAIKGYDPVAYFTEGKPLEGKAEFEVEWKGAKWRFASAEHLAMFKADPEAYAPQYGGY
jgi:YHS domain-containing protein